jgi:hypothetical protein
MLQVTGTGEADTCVRKPPGGFSEDFLYVADIELIYNSHQKYFTKERFITYYHLTYKNGYHVNVHLSLNDYHFR